MNAWCCSPNGQIVRVFICLIYTLVRRSRWYYSYGARFTKSFQSWDQTVKRDDELLKSIREMGNLSLNRINLLGMLQRAFNSLHRNTKKKKTTNPLPALSLPKSCALAPRWGEWQSDRGRVERLNTHLLFTLYLHEIVYHLFMPFSLFFSVPVPYCSVFLAFWFHSCLCSFGEAQMVASNMDLEDNLTSLVCASLHLQCRNTGINYRCSAGIVIPRYAEISESQSAILLFAFLTDKKKKKVHRVQQCQSRVRKWGVFSGRSAGMDVRHYT